MAQAYWHTPSHNRGWLLETLVFLDLRRRGLELSYFRSQEGFEVDFLARGFDTEPQAIQVSAQVNDPKTREREVRALEAVMGERGLTESSLVTLDEESRIETPSGLIHLVPAWR